ncbi:hypothetical protein V495_06116 [Pseudogymnoascus sp. VKM F-4514 (FW-929)]|nr:hypothetical protein V495_06116 [Pseudogymnoascus sp. VKM F-4514 (FW-929)]KFY55480.1 hypothetical protein V497_06943 [Pseudogymnoascus sp. VKM F-4516 (FW-969)]
MTGSPLYDSEKRPPGHWLSTMSTEDIKNTELSTRHDNNSSVNLFTTDRAAITNNMDNSIDEIGQTFNHMRHGTGIDHPSSEYEKPTRELPSSVQEKQAAISLPTRNRNRVKINNAKSQCRSFLDPRPRNRTRSPPNTTQTVVLSPSIYRNRPRSTRKGQRRDPFSSRAAGTSNDRQRVANECGKDPSDVTLFHHFREGLDHHADNAGT